MRLSSKITVIIIVVIVAIYFALNMQYNKYYESDYYDVLQMQAHSSANDIISVYGKPNKILYTSEDKQENMVFPEVCKFVYDDFSVRLNNYKEDNLSNAIGTSVIEIYTDKFKFGKEKIGIGSFRDDVRKAYASCKKTKLIKTESNDVKDTFFDNHVHITYFYDKTNALNLIEFFWYY